MCTQSSNLFTNSLFAATYQQVLLTLCVHPMIPVLPAYSIGSTLHKAMVTSSKLDFCWMLEANKLGPLRHQPQPAVAWNIKASDNSCR